MLARPTQGGSGQPPRSAPRYAPAVIVTRVPDGLAIVRQVDHQEQCRQMADAWGNDAFARITPFGPIADAARWHDEGWRSWEDAPEVDDEGAPLGFQSMDRATHLALYRVGIARAAESDPRAGLLVSMHGQGLYESRLGLDGPPEPRDSRPPEVREYLVEQEGLQSELSAAIGGGDALRRWAWDGYRLLQAWDALSLWLLWRGLPDGRGGALPQVPRAAGDAGVDLRLAPAGEGRGTMTPFPFRDEEAELTVPARIVPDRRYDDSDDLRIALDEAPWIALRHTLTPGRAS
jgi:uncharacterized protein DUF3891